MGKKLTDLTERTATADTDLIHVNSGGTDYKQSKEKFLHGRFATEFSTSSTLTSQVDALSADATYFGYLWNYGHTSTTGMPINTLSYIKVSKANASDYAVIEAISAIDSDRHYIIFKINGSWQTSWTELPGPGSISSINSELANRFHGYIIGSGGDLNNYIHSGLYYISSGMSNAPTTWAALVVIGPESQSYCSQLCFNGNGAWVRSRTGTPLTWTSWRSL